MKCTRSSCEPWTGSYLDSSRRDPRRQPRSIRRLRRKLQRDGYDACSIAARGALSQAAPVATSQRLLALYRDRYQGFNVRHSLRRPAASTASVLLRLRQEGPAESGLVPKHALARTLRRSPRPCFGSSCISTAVAIAAHPVPDQCSPHPFVDNADQAACSIRTPGQRGKRRGHMTALRRSSRATVAHGPVHRPRPLGRPPPWRRGPRSAGA